MITSDNVKLDTKNGKNVQPCLKTKDTEYKNTITALLQKTKQIPNTSQSDTDGGHCNYTPQQVERFRGELNANYCANVNMTINKEQTNNVLKQDPNEHNDQNLKIENSSMNSAGSSANSLTFEKDESILEYLHLTNDMSQEENELKGKWEENLGGFYNTTPAYDSNPVVMVDKGFENDSSYYLKSYSEKPRTGKKRRRNRTIDYHSLPS